MNPPLFFILGASALPAAADTLRLHLSILLRQNVLHLVTDADRPEGAGPAAWEAEQLRAAHATVLLLAPESLATIDVERAVRTSARVLPIIVRPCRWTDWPGIAGRVPLPRDGRPALSSDEAWAEIAGALLQLARKAAS